MNLANFTSDKWNNEEGKNHEKHAKGRIGRKNIFFIC